ncbi:LysM repeat protein [Nocardioides marinisabuli]|uniref:LysM repeat protein n=1 Tax=Nocardioides marinisabuli TaxID=419476 RepID=A0A7Y9F188_9ACTN|nr:LysM peptidoglycan-binding domain-containing protein [Nocardioides marinisabuli]NYD57737.1 LysM repeat protein [Nocardioides marinisabuli]
MSTMTLTAAPAPIRLGAVRATRRTTPGSLRLTRRGRLAVLAAGLLLVALVGVVLAGVSVATSESGTAPATETITVGVGDTLWAIAAERAESGDVREVIGRIQQLNSLDGGLVVTGQRLVVPAG